MSILTVASQIYLFSLSFPFSPGLSLPTLASLPASVPYCYPVIVTIIIITVAVTILGTVLSIAFALFTLGSLVQHSPFIYYFLSFFTCLLTLQY